MPGSSGKGKRPSTARKTREELVRRTDEQLAGRTGAGPLVWDDIAALVQGIAFAERPIREAAAGVTERHSLGPRGTWILNLIATDFVYPHELADLFEIGRSLMSVELARLSEAGLIVSQPGSDRRRTRLALTPDGEAALDEVRRELERIMRAGLTGYSPDEVRRCTRMLRDLRQAMPSEER